MRYARIALATATALTFAAAPSFAQEKYNVQNSQDQEWVSLNGKVESVSGDNFTLDYGKGDITVEMDDYDSYNENLLRPGDRVTVTGKMDNDFYERRKIEASSVYVDKLKEAFFANAADEEEAYDSFHNGYAADDEWIRMTGTVVSKNGDEIVLDTGLKNMKVDIGEMTVEPRIDPGDRVTVYGEMDDADLFEGREILAKSVVVLSQG